MTKQRKDKLHDTSPEARAMRLRRLRNLANLSRKEMCKYADIKPDTLIGWEVARHGGLTENGAKKVVFSLTKQGVQCTVEWLLYGIGKGATVIENFSEVSKSLAKKTTIITDEEKQIIKELLFFKKHNPDAIDFMVPDDSMDTPYSKGDYVAGIKRYKDKFHTAIGLDCIIQTADGKLLLRKLLESDEKEKYDLVSTNLASKAHPLILHNISIAYLAPVIWHRRKNKY